MRPFLTTAILLAILPLLLACVNAAEVPTAPPGPAAATATTRPAATATPRPTATATPWPTATTTPLPTATPLSALAALFPPPVPYDRTTASPARTPVGLILNEPEAFPGYTLFRPPGQNPYLIDNQGRVVHQWEIAQATNFARLLENGNLLTSVRGRVDNIREIDPTGRVVWKYTAPGQHHDLLKMPNGNVLLLMKGRKSAAEVIARGGNPASIKRDLELDYIIEVRPTGPDSGEIVWQWSVWDHLIQDFDASLPNYGTVAERPERVDLNYRLRPDWLHVTRSITTRNWIKLRCRPVTMARCGLLTTALPRPRRPALVEATAAGAAICCTAGAIPRLTGPEPPPTSSCSAPIMSIGLSRDCPARATSSCLTMATRKPGKPGSIPRSMKLRRLGTAATTG